jgi:RNA polymerase sigma factor (sigma-70 family)
MKFSGEISTNAENVTRVGQPIVMAIDRDAELLAAFVQGDARAARELTSRLAPRAYAFAYSRLHDRAAAEDVAQEALIRLWKIAPVWETGKAKISTWLHTITGNLCIDRQRSTGRRKENGGDACDTLESEKESAEQKLILQDRASALEDALSTLPDRQRQAVSLRHLEELSNPEIAEIMDIGVEAVESLTARGRKKLTETLNKRKELL